jgi:predicted DNA-binding protein
MREQTTIRLPTELMEQLRREAQERGYPAKDLIMFILSDYVENQDSPASVKTTGNLVTGRKEVNPWSFLISSKRFRPDSGLCLPQKRSRKG